MWKFYPHLHSWSICEFDPHVQKFHVHILSKNLVSKIDQNNGLFSMEPDLHGTRLEGHPNTIPMSWIQWSQWFVDPSNGHDSVACWIPPPIGFQGHLLNPYSGHRMETVYQKGFPVGRTSVFRQVPCGNASHTFTVKEFAKPTHMCKNWTFTYWAKP